MLQFIEQANKHHPTIKFAAEISETETTFLDTNIYKGERFRSNSVLDVRTHFKPTETFQHTHFSSCHPSEVKKGFIKGQALRLLRTNETNLAFRYTVPPSSAKLKTNPLERLALNRATTIAQKKLTKTRPISYKRGRSIKDILVRTKL